MVIVVAIIITVSVLTKSKPTTNPSKDSSEINESTAANNSNDITY